MGECIWGCFGNCVDVLVICVLVRGIYCVLYYLYCVLVLFRLCIFILICFAVLVEGPLPPSDN